MDDLPVLPTIGQSPCAKHKCSQCCHDTEMLLTNSDVARLEASGANPEGWFEAEDGYIQLRLSNREALPGHTGTPCFFLDGSGQCSVYDARPAGCRIYPAVWDGVAVLDEENCPHTEGFVLPKWADGVVGQLADTLNEENQQRPQSG